MENNEKDNQRPLVIGGRDPHLDETDETQVGNDIRRQRANFHRNVGEGPQVPIPNFVHVPQVVHLPVDASITGDPSDPEVVQNPPIPGNTSVPKVIQVFQKDQTPVDPSIPIGPHLNPTDPPSIPPSIPVNDLVPVGESVPVDNMAPENNSVPVNGRPRVPQSIQLLEDASDPDSNDRPRRGRPQVYLLEHSVSFNGSDQFKRRSNSRDRIDNMYKLRNKVRRLPISERKTRSKERIDYTEGRFPPGLTNEDLYVRCNTPPDKRRRVNNTKSSPIIIVSSSDNEQQIYNDDIQDEPPHESDNMTRIDSDSSKTVLEFDTQITQSGSEADNVTNPMPLSYQIPATEPRSTPELNEDPNVTANVASRANPGEEHNVVSQPQIFSSDTVYFTASENFAMSDPPILGHGPDGVNAETLANGEISNSIENRARDLSEIEASQFPPVNLPQPFNLPQTASTLVSELKGASKRILLARKEQALAEKEQIQAMKEQIQAEESQIQATKKQIQAEEEQIQATKKQIQAEEEQVQVTKKQIQAAEERSLREELEIEEQLKNLD